MKKGLFSLVLFLDLIILTAQPLWHSFEQVPGGPKTGIGVLEDSCLIIGLTKGLLKSCDNGQTYDSILSTTVIYSVYTTISEAILAGGAGKIFVSTDSGTSWDTVPLLNPYPIRQFLAHADGDLFAISGVLDIDLGFIGDGVFFSQDGGVSWSQRNHGLGIYTSCENIAVDKNGTLYLALADEFVTGNSGLFFSKDKGLNWEHIEVAVDGQNVVPDQIKIANTSGLSVAPDDSIYYSFEGTAVNVLVRLNVKKHIDDVPNTDFWNVYNISGGSQWWLDWPLNNLFFGTDNNWYSSTRGSVNTGTTWWSKEDRNSWERIDAGLGFNVFGRRDNQVFSENSTGTLFMVQLLDEHIYYLERDADPTPVRTTERVNELLIYPNPAVRGQQLFTYFARSCSSCAVSIYNHHGREIGTDIKTWSLRAPQNPGLYFVIVTKGKERYIAKVLVH